MEKTKYIKEEKVLKLIDSVPNNTVASKLAYFYSIFSDSTRIKIIVALISSEMCVQDISIMLGINQTTISHQLKTLRSVGAVQCKRQNKYLLYSVSNRLINNIMLNGVDYIFAHQTA